MTTLCTRVILSCGLVFLAALPLAALGAPPAKHGLPPSVTVKSVARILIPSL